MDTIDLIARGGFGRVDRVRLADGTIAARKTFVPPHGLDAANLEKLRKRFGREVRTQRALNSPSFLPILDSDLDRDDPWFVMPLAERSLQTEVEACKASGTVPAKALADLLNGLEELHAMEMVHRDLKPQNVLLHEGVWKLSDFGLVLPLTAETTQLTSTDSAWGTVHYAAPEQAVGFHTVGPSADIYAFGCVLHDIFGVAGRVPYHRHSAPGPIGAIIEKCTENDPKRRFKSIHAVRGALLTSLASTPTITIGGAAADWASRIPACSSWVADDVTELASAILRLSNWNDRYAVFSVIDEAAIEVMAAKNYDSWKVVALAMCEWAEGGFEWSFCDVIIGRLEKLFELGDLEIKACAAVAAAELASSHNRWYVMRRLIAMCGPGLDGPSASRITIEAMAREKLPAFQRCVDVIGIHPATAYHATLATALAGT